MRRSRHGGAAAARPGVLATLILALGAPAPAAPQAPPDGAAGAGAAGWSGRVSVSRYFVPDQPDYFLPTAAADKGPLHLEARYHYEDRETGSLFVGWNLEFGQALELRVVPMLGGVVGRTSGVAPGLELTLGWGLLEYYLESEVVLDVGDASASYFYAWSQLTASPLEWLHAGLVLQRTRVVHTQREISPGLFVGVSGERLEATFYLFNPGADAQYESLSAGVHF
jgi:hypothetical protein